MVAITRIGTSQNLETGGTYDLLIMGFPNGFPRGYVSFEIGDTPRRVTGVQKVVQTFLFTLLSGVGSDPIKTQRGTGMSYYVKGANIGGDYEEMVSMVREAIQDAESQTKAILNTSEGDTASQLAKVDILFCEAQDTELNVGLRFTTLEGQTAAIAIPFPQTDLEING